MRTRTAVRVLGMLLIAALIFGLWYDFRFSMDVIASETFNNPESTKRILIASQGSDYKNELTSNLVKHIDDSIYIEVVDVTTLADVDIDLHDLFILIYSWEIWEAPVSVTQFIQDQARRDRIFLVGTSGRGDLSITGLNGITSASQKSEIGSQVTQVVSWINDRI